MSLIQGAWSASPITDQTYRVPRTISKYGSDNQEHESGDLRPENKARKVKQVQSNDPGIDSRTDLSATALPPDSSRGCTVHRQ